MKSRWSINGRFLTQPLSGVQRYASEIVHAIDGILSEGHELAERLSIELVAPLCAETIPALKAIPVRRAGSGSGQRWEQTALPRAATGGVLSLCNTGPLAMSRQIVCIHDVNTRVFPQSYAPAFRTLYRVLTPALGRIARRITTVSRYSAAQIAAYRVAPEHKIGVAPNGYEHALRWWPDFSRRVRAAAGPDTVFLLGGAAPHKNAGLLLGLAGELGRAGLRLALAGPEDARVFRAAAQDVEAKNVIWLGRLSDEEIAAMLSDCLCLAFPSYAEGFGLPVVEAMAWSCPVIASDRTSLPEIGGDAALYACPDDPGAWLRQILRLRGDLGLRERMIQKGHAQVRKFSWRASAEFYLQAMAETV